MNDPLVGSGEMTMRQIRAPLAHAVRLATRPECIPKGRPRGAKRLGIKYECDVAKHMPWAMHGPWFEFADGQGRGLCQPDLMWFQGDFVIVGEVKHTWVPEAEVKLQLLYMPVVAKATGKKPIGLVICKNLVPGVRACYGDLQSALTFAYMAKEKIPTFHWMGKSAIGEPILVVRKAA